MMTQKSAACGIHSAIQFHVNNSFACPQIMAAVDTLAESLSDQTPAGLLCFIWHTLRLDETGWRFGSMGYQLVHEWASPRKSQALKILTDRTRDEWLAVLEW